MAPRWQPGEQYTYGDVVEFEGIEYKIILPHPSQGDWTPPVTPALWGRVQGEYRREEKCGGDYKPSSPAPGYGQQQQYAANQKSYQAPPAQPSQPEEEHKEKGWFEEHKKELEIGGGLLAGATAIAGGLLAYKHHEQKSEEKRGQVWAFENWHADSMTRTKQWRAGQWNAPVAWIWNEGTSIPRDAIQGGEEKGEALYICRAYHQSGLLVGKACRGFHKGAVIGFKKDEMEVDAYEILVGDSRAIRWVPCSGQLNLQSLRARPVEGGREPDGHAIYIAQAPYHGAVYPGKACEIYGDGCFIACNGTEKKVKEYAVLCYA